MAADHAFKGTGSRSSNSNAHRSANSDADPDAANEFDFDSNDCQLNCGSGTDPGDQSDCNSLAVPVGRTIASVDSRTAV
jgi:hypothetical protein